VLCILAGTHAYEEYAFRDFYLIMLSPNAEQMPNKKCSFFLFFDGRDSPVLPSVTFQVIRSAGAVLSASVSGLTPTCLRKSTEPKPYLIYGMRSGLDRPSTTAAPSSPTPLDWPALTPFNRLPA
jgi:hypothetical protein